MQWPCGRTDAFGFNPYTIVGSSALASPQGRSGADKAPVFGEAGAWGKQSAKPGGYSAGGAYSLAVKAGGMSSWQPVVVFAGSGNAAQGRNIDASSSITFSSSGSAAAIASASGSSSIVFSASGNAVAPLAMSGSASASFAASGVLAGIASITASTSVTFSADATLTAKGWMIAVPIDQSLSASTIADAVWGSSASANNDAGTMGELLNNSGAGANPWTVTLEGTYTAADLMRIMTAVLAGKVTGAETGNPVFRSVDDTENRVTAVVSGGNRSSVIINGD